MIQSDILNEVALERRRQDENWGEQNHRDSVWLAILTEEVGEAARAILEGKNPMGEIIQIAAVAVAWEESRVRGKKCECGLCKDK